MNKKTIEALYHELPDLVQKGVLTQDAAEKLRAHYGEAKSQDKKWLMMLIYGLAGTILIGLGIILLFAHNWDEFSKQTRTVLSLLPLLLAQTFAGWVLLKRPASNILKECSATFLSLMVGSCMALICQTYNISGTPTTFTITWMMLILPLVYLLQASIPAVIYCIGISSWASHMMFTDRSLAILFWPLIALVIPHFLWSLKQEKFALRSTILSFVMMLCIFISGQGTLLGNLPQSSIVTSGALVTIFYLLGSYKFNGLSSNWQTPLLRLGALGIFIEGFILSFRFSWEAISGSRNGYISFRQNLSAIEAFPADLINILIISLSVLMFYDFLKRRQFMKSLFGALTVLVTFGYFISMKGIPPIIPAIFMNIFLFILSITRIIMGARNNKLDLLNTGMLMLAVLILARFFDSDIGFIAKGLAFILIGLGFLLTNIKMISRSRGQK